MILIAGTALAFLAGILFFHKPRNKMLFYINTIIYEIKYNTMGVQEIVREFVFARYNKTDLPQRNGKVAIVTGGSRGIGCFIVKMLLQCDMEVIVACRNIKAGEDAVRKIRESGVTSGTAKVYHMDNASLESVRKFCREIKNDYRRIDTLINNAGIMFTPYFRTKEGFEQQWVVNYLSHFLLTALLLPLLKNAGSPNESARVINVTSCAHLVGTIDFDHVDDGQGFLRKFAYARSKLAQVMFTKTIQELFSKKKLPVQSYAVHPGLVNTDIYQHTSMKHLKILFNILFKTPIQGATPVVYAAVNKSIENKGGIYVTNCLESPVNPEALNLAIRDRLFKLSLEQVQLKDFFET